MPPETTGQGRSWRVTLLIAAGVAATAVVFSLPPIPQDPGYHQFADQRRMLGIPNALNVLSSSPFTVVGIFGLARVARAGAGWERAAFLVLFASVALTGAGSAYYHLAPTTATLFWDRLPMTIVFTSCLALVFAERVSPRAGPWLLAAFGAAGAASVVSWQVGETAGTGDLRPYALVQLLPAILIPLALVLFPARRLRTADLLAVLGWYTLAKLVEALDHPIFALGGIVSGHTLKHLAAATATAWLLRAAAGWRRAPT
jgi:ceramidase